MKNQISWQKIKSALKENSIEPDFQSYQTTAFSGVDFDKGLEIFRYILELRITNHDETKSVFEKLELYANGQLNKDILEKLIQKYEPFLKKLFNIITTPFPAYKALAWGYNQLFDKLSVASNNSVQTIRNDFFSTDASTGVKKPTFQSTHFNNLLTDNSNFGKPIHSSYHLRNSNIHNDPHINNRKIPDFITDTINSYLYFTFKYYNELCAVIPHDEIQPPTTSTFVNLASLSGGAYNPDIENEVKRDNIIQTIDNKINNFDVLFIEGDEGIGKTTILHQFVRKYPNNCFAYFIDGKDSSTFSNLAILKVLCNQLHFANKGRELEEDAKIEHFNEDWLRDYLNTERIRNKSSQTFYYVIDGLDELSQDRQSEIKELILDKLPYDKANFKLILSGQQNINLIKQGCQYDKYEIPFLSKEESTVIFGNNITLEQFDDLNRVCKNNAGKIAFFRDLIKKQEISIENILDKLSSDLRSIYQFLWNYTAEFDENSKIILAIIAYQDEKYNAK